MKFVDLSTLQLDTSPMSMRVKLADFGLAYQDIFEGQESQFNVRWAAPEIWRKLMDIAEENSDDDSCESSSDEDDEDEDNDDKEEDGHDKNGEEQRLKSNDRNSDVQDKVRIKDSSKGSSNRSNSSRSRSGMMHLN